MEIEDRLRALPDQSPAPGGDSMAPQIERQIAISENRRVRRRLASSALAGTLAGAACATFMTPGLAGLDGSSSGNASVLIIAATAVIVAAIVALLAYGVVPHLTRSR